MGLIQRQYEELRKKLRKSELENQARAFRETRFRQRQNTALLGNIEKLKEEVRRIRSESVGNWDLLKKAILRLEENQFRVMQARDAHEACQMILCEIGSERMVVKSKSNVSKEIGLTPYLRDHGIDIIETDIGDRITQIAGHRASHYTGPSCHLSRYDIARILSEHVGREIDPDPVAIMHVITDDLEAYLRQAKTGITGANAIAAQEGAALMLHNEGNITRVRTRAKHLILTSIDKVYPKIEDALLMLRLETFLATGALFPSFIDIVAGRSKSADIEKKLFYGVHEPASVVLVLLDNGRKEILEDETDFADLLQCIGCGACLLSCPTYSAVGSRFGRDGMLGGRGVALSCLQRGVEAGIEDGLFLCTACSLCGETCPVGIDAGKRLKKLRKSAVTRPEIACNLEELTQLQTTLDEQGTPYGMMVKTDLPAPRAKASSVLYVGCVGRSTEVETAMASIKLLQRLGVNVTLIDEVCCEAVKEEVGFCPSRERMEQNIERIIEAGGREVFFICPTCLKTFQDYGQRDLGGLIFKTLMAHLDHHFTFTALSKDPATITYHDPCHLGRGLGSFGPTREVLAGLGCTIVEMDHHHRESLCCGAGGGIRGLYPKISREIARRRVAEAREVRADILLTDCLSCKHNLKQGVQRGEPMRVMTTPEYLFEGIEAGRIRFSERENSPPRK